MLAGAASPSSGGPWIDEPVSFSAGGLTVYGTFRHPTATTGSVPAVLLIAGSGPTDRNGNNPLVVGRIDTLRELAKWLSQDGVASLRYDKLGSGQTGLGPYKGKVDSVGVQPFEQESAAALTYLAHRPGVDAHHLGVFGHSEGALFALLLATGHAGRVPPIRALGLLEPLAIRYLDVLTVQADAQLAAQVKSGAVTPQLSATVKSTLAGAIARLRSTGTVRANLPYGLASELNGATATFLYQADRLDPGVLAAQLPARTPVIVSCSDVDAQVSCGEVDHLLEGLAAANALTDDVRLRGVDHVLKVDPTGSSVNYAKPLPFSSTLRAAVQRFVDREL
ncbi:MAG: alpha/beta hydrolase family protein [Acidimicrobiales bacterium]